MLSDGQLNRVATIANLDAFQREELWFSTNLRGLASPELVDQLAAAVLRLSGSVPTVAHERTDAHG